MKRYIGWALVAFAFYLIVQSPNEAAQVVSNTGELIGRLAEQSASFVRGVLNA